MNRANGKLQDFGYLFHLEASEETHLDNLGLAGRKKLKSLEGFVNRKYDFIRVLTDADTFVEGDVN